MLRHFSSDHSSYGGEAALPTYEYECTHCGHTFEVRQGFSEEPLSLCPRGLGYVRRLIYPAPVIFKGKGFYATDHGRSSTVGTHRDEGAEAGEARPTADILAEQEKSKAAKAEAGPADTKS